MYFEATYVPSPSPSISTLSVENEDIKNIVDDVEETESDRPVDHLIFVIHGIGQQTEQYGQFYQHIENLQETTRQVLQAKVPDHNVRIELVPIEWHRHIHEQVDPIISKITLKSIPTIRLIENDYLADVLYYFSKDRGQKIVDNVTNLFNTSYHNFMEKHPNFDGKIIILGYSLGGIITWDILSHQRTSITEEEEVHYKKLDVTFPKLDFKPHHFFGLGSPIGAVLTFRGQSPEYYKPDDDITIENVFHPFDPLGYRMEPLFSDYYTDQPAVLVERSVPIGPSFSFPSMPSFPLSTGSFFSFFSWGQQPAADGKDAAKDIYKATEVAAEDNAQETSNDQAFQSTSTGFLNAMTSMMQYFSRGTSKTPASSDLTETQKEDQDDLIAWDPLSRQETREQLLSLRDDLNRTLGDMTIMDTTTTSMTQKRPKGAARAFTYGPRYHSSSSSSSSSESSSFTEETDGKLTPPKLRTAVSEMYPHRSQHMVEVLGIDGLRMDQRKRPGFNRAFTENNRKKSSTSVNDNDNNDDDTSNDDDTKVEDDGSNNIWLDLNNELNRPGPAITSPGESAADVAQDATVSNGSADEEDKTTDKQEEEDEAMKQERLDKEERAEMNKLPGKTRMDYVLQPESVMSMIANEYLVGLRAHFSYWTNKDFIWHMLRRIELDNVLDSKSDTQ